MCEMKSNLNYYVMKSKLYVIYYYYLLSNTCDFQTYVARQMHIE
jgi:hypothetical protein